MASTVMTAGAASREALPQRHAGRWARNWMAALLRVPLPLKLLGSNGIVLAIAVMAALATHGAEAEQRHMLALLVGALTIGFVVNVLLVLVALRPMRALEETASRVWRGELDARVAPSPLADADIARTGDALNLLLDSLAAERGRLRTLASQVIRAQDEERARIARDLHDSTAQSWAAVVLQLSAAARDAEDRRLAARLEEIRDLAAGALEETRVLSHAIYPRVLDDLGLSAALDWLARRTREQWSIKTGVVVDGADEVPAAAASVLYLVAQEALLNAVRHASPSLVEVRLTTGNGWASLDIVDDGAGFDVAAAELRRPALGLFAMRERVGLVNGSVEIASAPGAGTRVTARIPLTNRGSNDW